MADSANAPTNVVVVIADALRRDAVFGDHPSMPKLAARFRSWNVMSRYFSAAPWTLPACTSLLTGCEAGTHAHFAHAHSLTQPTLTESFGAERVKAAFVNNKALARNSGLFGDFDEYELITDHDETIARAHTFLDARDTDRRPFFLVVHSNLVHDYYLRSTRGRYASAFPDRDDWFELGDRVIRWNGLSETQANTVRRMYDACTRALDDQFDRLLARLGPNTVACFVSDHGEGLAPELARVHHGGRLHDDLLRVPCAFRVPDGAGPSIAEAMKRAEVLPVTTSDLLPTLLDIVGADVPDHVRAGSLVRGAENGPHRRLRSEDRRYLYLRNRHRLNVNTHGKNMSAVARWRNNAFRATVAQDFRVRSEIDYPYKVTATEFVARNALMVKLGGRLLRATHNGDPLVVTDGRSWQALELVDLEADPGERRNLLAEPGACPPEVRAWVDAWARDRTR